MATLPGISLTVGAMELASSQIIAGGSRLTYGIAQLALLVFGVTLGLEVAGEVNAQTPSAQMGTWSLYVAAVVVGAGLYIYLSAPRGSLIWLVVAIGVALLAQALAGAFLTDGHSGFIGAIVAVPFSNLASRIKTAPPAGVITLATFWALVPGALSFETAGQAAEGGALGLASLGSAVTAILSIGLGTIVGWSIFQTIDSRLWLKGSQPLT